MVKKKYTSKRIRLTDKYKVQRRVVEKHRKDRKTAKRNTKMGVIDHKALFKKKDPGIPNSWPFKQELLHDIAQEKERDAQRKVDAKKSPKNLQELMDNSLVKADQFEAKFGSSSKTAATEDGTEKSASLGQQSRRAYLRDLKKVIEASDVILQILDCRDPISTRLSSKVEETIVSHFNKKLVLVLNKVDLVPKEIVQKWLTYLRQYYPTIAVRAGISSSGGAIGRSKGDAALENSTNAIGMEGLLQLLKNYARISPKESTKTCITVGVIGYPNVGKSSLLNSLKRVRAVGVSSRPGFTTSIQEVVLDKNIRLLDSPGVVLDSDEAKDGTQHVLLRNCIDIESMEDPVPAIQSLLSRCDYNSLLMTYSIPAFPKDNYEMFLAMIAKKYNKVLKGGIPDKMNAARTVLRHWNTGKIPFFTLPPTLENTAPNKENVSIVTQFDKELELDFMKSLEKQNNQTIDALDCVQFQSDSSKGMNSNDGLVKMLVSDEVMEEDESDVDEKQEEEDEDEDSDDSMDEVLNSRRLEKAEDFDFQDL